MAQSVVTELVIDSSGATDGANVFAQAMAGAEQAANNGVASVTGFNVGLLALGTGATAVRPGVPALTASYARVCWIEGKIVGLGCPVLGSG